MNENILLTEADYKDKYPPLGLMKISTFHKLNGDNVEYSRKFQKKNRNFYSKIYIATRFSFHWDKTRKLIKYYQKNFDTEILIGGIHASINPDLYEKEFGIKPNIGSLKGDIGSILDKIKVDEFLSLFLNQIVEFGIDVLPPDYLIFENQDLPFNLILKNNYLLRATKGCIRNCSFCDVKRICEGYIDKLPLLPIINYINRNFGIKTNALLFDDNTLMSKSFDSIIYELSEAGFAKGTRLNRRLRSVDFNQGMDLRLLKDNLIVSIDSININPVRFAFDDISMKDIYISQIKKVIEIGISNISVYVLYNYNDTPQDFYDRLRISIDLNKQYGCRIFSFPMKYVPNEMLDRKFVGIHWTRRMIRGIQCILNSSHGIVPVNEGFFDRAFGKDFNEFYCIINLPEKYIIYRKEMQSSIDKLKMDLTMLTDYEKGFVHKIISEGKFKNLIPTNFSSNITNILEHYKNE